MKHVARRCTPPLAAALAAVIVAWFLHAGTSTPAATAGRAVPVGFGAFIVETFPLAETGFARQAP